MDKLIFTLAEENDLIFGIADDDQLDFELKEPSPESFHGEYIFTPTDEPQEIETAKKYMAKNIVIEPIPSNYGHIEWDGAILKVY